MGWFGYGLLLAALVYVLLRDDMRRRRALRLVGTVLAVCVLSGCVTPAFDQGAYHQNAVAAIGSGLSETRTARLAVGVMLEDKVTGAIANIVITDSENALWPIQDTFGNVDPPTRPDDALRDDVLRCSVTRRTPSPRPASLFGEATSLVYESGRAHHGASARSSIPPTSAMRPPFTPHLGWRATSLGTATPISQK
jgi:hypothetical protein